jgi:hypothetical protein
VRGGITTGGGVSRRHTGSGVTLLRRITSRRIALLRGIALLGRIALLRVTLRRISGHSIDQI